MKTILYQGKPTEGDHWFALNDAFVLTFKATHNYLVRELVLRADAEKAALDARISSAQDAEDAARYRWLRDPKNDIGHVIDKDTGGGNFEYRAGEDLDNALDGAMDRATEKVAA